MNTETIYVDCLYHCHRTDDGTMTAIQTNAFMGKCDTFVEGHAYDNSKGYLHIYPWKSYSELEAAQEQYERMMAEAEAAYREGVNSVD